MQGVVGLFGQVTSLVTTPAGPRFLAGGDVLGFGLDTIAETGIQGFRAEEIRVAETAPSEVALRTFTPCAGACGPRTFLSTDGGATFVHQGYWLWLFAQFFAEVHDLAFDPVTADRRFELITSGLMLTEPSGARPLDSSPIVGHEKDTVEISGAGALLVGGTSGVRVSRDGGANWTTTLSPATAGGSRWVIDLRVDPGAPDRLLALALETVTAQPAAPAKVAAYRSVDAGESWGPILPTVTTTLLDVEAGPGSAMTLFVLVAVPGGSELLRSDDGGVTSVSVHTFASADGVSDFAIDAVARDVLYAASATGLLRSRDGGATWKAAPGTFDAWGPYRARLRQLGVHPTERGHVFAAPVDGGLFENRLSD